MSYDEEKRKKKRNAKTHLAVVLHDFGDAVDFEDGGLAKVGAESVQLHEKAVDVRVGRRKEGGPLVARRGEICACPFCARLEVVVDQPRIGLVRSEGCPVLVHVLVVPVEEVPHLLHDQVLRGLLQLGLALVPCQIVKKVFVVHLVLFDRV